MSSLRAGSSQLVNKMSKTAAQQVEKYIELSQVEPSQLVSFELVVRP
jgi:hypothetical protein